MIKIYKKEFGALPDGTRAALWTVDNGAMSFSACDYGCLLTSVLLPKQNGGFEDIALGFSSFDDFVKRNDSYMGALVGRYSNRIANAVFSMDGKQFRLDANYGTHYLHGGFVGYHQMIWQSKELTTDEGTGIRFTRTSPDGEQGFPGKLELEIDYLLNEQNELILRYRAKTSAKTPLSLTNHIYFNLLGEGNPSVAEHIAQIHSSRYLQVVDRELIPTGKILSVEGTIFDFRAPVPLGRYFGDPALEIMRGGYDAAYCFDPVNSGKAAFLPLLAEIHEPQTGRKLRCRSNQPCMQLYTGCNLKVKDGKNGHSYGQYSGFCLETQQYTNAPNIAAFPQPFLKPEENWESITVYGFSWNF